jgi:predicted RNA-binding Zn-ribbon protein involved in translation (DUF1610 family)
MKIKDMKGVGKKKKERTVLRCPQCGSDNITYELGLITGYKYFCKDCKYVGPLVIQDSEEKETGAGEPGSPGAGGKGGDDKGGNEAGEGKDD